MGFFGGGSSVDLASPPAIGNTTPNTGAFTTLSFAPANNTTGFSNTSNSLTGSNAQSLINLAQTWNTTGTPTAINLNITNTASNSSSKFIDFQIGGISQCFVGYNGANPVFNIKSTTATVYSIAGNGASLLFYYGASISNSIVFTFGVPGIVMPSTGSYGFGASTDVSSGAGDLYLVRDAANILAQRRTTNAQTFRLYNTFTDASNYERGFFRWNTNVLEIGAEAAGTGTKRTTRITAQDKTGGYNPIIELGFYPDNTLFRRLSFTNNAGSAVQWGIDGSFIGNFSTDGFMVGSAQIGWNSGVPQNAADLVLTRDAADILAQRRATNSQTFRLYRTFTNSTNYERLSFIATRTTRFAIAAENAGTGAARSLEISFYTSASDPASTDITDGCFSVWKNSGTGTIKLWANDGGTMKSVALA